MPTRSATIAEIQYLLDSQSESEAKLSKLNSDMFRDEALYAKYRGKLEQQLDEVRKDLDDALENYAFFPQRHYERHNRHLNEFWDDGKFEKNVFIMTRFAQPGTSDANALETVIEHVRDKVTAMGYIPRVASDKKYHDWLWDNVELYMLGSKYGVAILEDKCAQELNPNVAMEWGWMLGMGRKVLMLREQEFDQLRADWAGRLESTFDWNNPMDAIQGAIETLLPSTD
ncbi:MAG: hypothetical protein BA863_18245 [Desulfovibrio sp. S3730MH75]|nr:MAG: hypothetical protein BA863_18245 [Desulfovibrio sp. S3730MH75]